MRRRTEAEPISQRALNRALLARQALLAREQTSPLAMIRRLAGMQSQAPNPPYVGLWTRLHDFPHAALADLLVGRQAVRLALMRSTIHLVAAEDALAWRPLVQPAIERMLEGGYGTRLAGVDRAAVAAAGRALVEDRPRTFEELGRLLGETWPEADPRALAEVIRGYVPLVQVPPRGIWGQGGPIAHTSLEAWTGRPLDPAPDLPAMIRRYLASYGPASPKDAQAWSLVTGMTPAFAALRGELRVFRSETGVELFDLPEEPRPDPDTPAPPRFLAEWENAFLSYADRTRIISEPDRKVVFTVNGIVKATFLLDGFVHGLWRVERAPKGGRATLVIEPFRPVPAAERVPLLEEGARLLAFVAGDAADRDVQITPARLG